AELELSRLAACVELECHRVGILPADTNTRRLADQTRRTEGLAKIARCAVALQIPGGRLGAAARVHGNARDVADGRRDHAPAPVLVDDGHPLTRDVEQRAVATARGRPGAAPLRGGTRDDG